MIVVTGAAGLIGSAVVRELNRRGLTDLLLVDHLGTSDKWMNLRSLRYAEYNEKDRFITRIEKAIAEGSKAAGLAGVRTIIHLGACSATTERDASYLVENNYRYSVLMYDFARLVRARFVYASSAATYGDGANGYNDDDASMESLRPLNMYGYSKQMFDQHVKRSGFALAAGIKYFNVFGPNEYHKGDMMSVVLKGYRQIRETGKIKLFKSYRADYPDGGQQRDFLYVKDAAQMTVFLALDKPSATGLFNAGSGKAQTWLDLVNPIFAAMGRTPAIEFIEMPENLRDRYQYYTCAPLEKLRRAGYQQEITPLAHAVSEYVKDFMAREELRA